MNNKKNKSLWTRLKETKRRVDKAADTVAVVLGCVCFAALFLLIGGGCVAVLITWAESDPDFWWKLTGFAAAVPLFFLLRDWIQVAVYILLGLGGIYGLITGC